MASPTRQNDGLADEDSNRPRWVYSRGGAQVGPLTNEQFFEALHAGKILATDAVFRQDTGWRAHGGDHMVRYMLRKYLERRKQTQPATTTARTATRTHAGTEPSSADEATWHFIHDGLEYGPVNDADLIHAASTGMLSRTDEVCQKGMSEWIPATDVEGLFDTEAPPPRAAVAPASGSGEYSQAAQTPLPAVETAAPVSYQSTPSNSGSQACPHCWHCFEPEDLLYISENPDLRGDSVLGEEVPRRFLPSRFTPDGHAIDSEGGICYDIACPRCHLRIPRPYVQMRPLFLSIVGAPASGKSYFLASMCWKLRTTLRQTFHIDFTDIDGITNRWLMEYTDKLFMQADDNAFQIIEKTELQGDHYRNLNFGSQKMQLSLPSMFHLRAHEASLFHCQKNDFINRALVLYDNAGEHFLPGENHPSTRHLMRAEALFFLFDPTKDPRFRKALASSQGARQDVQLKRKHTVQTQDVLLSEMINRIRVLLGLDPKVRYAKPVVILVTKSDILTSLMSAELREQISRDPWLWHQEIDGQALDLSTILQVSYATRTILDTYAPELVSAAESLLSNVIYVPVSALGHSPSVEDGRTDDDRALLVVQPCNVKPNWVEVPFLYVLYKLGHIPGVALRNAAHPVPEPCDVRGGQFHFVVPGTTRRLSVPLSYAGFSLRAPETDQWFRLPDEAPAASATAGN